MPPLPREPHYHRYSPDSNHDAWVEELRRAPAIMVAAFSLNMDDLSRGGIDFAAASDGRRLAMMEARPGSGENVIVKFRMAAQAGGEASAFHFVKTLQYNWTYVSWETAGHHSYAEAVAHAADLFWVEFGVRETGQ